MESTLSSNTIFTSISVSTLVSIIVIFIFKWVELHKSAEIAYKFEQTKKIKEAIGSHLGRILISCERLDDRLKNLSGNHDQGWLSLKIPASISGYYFKSTAIRFLNFYDCVFAAEEAYIALDARHADNSDYEFLNYIQIFKWVIRDIDVLFRGVPYDKKNEYDHLYADSLRDVRSRFKKLSNHDAESVEMCNFFDDPKNHRFLTFFENISKHENRPRWDRIIALHLLLVAFQDAFGSNRQKETISSLREIAMRINRPVVLSNFRYGLVEYDIHLPRTGCKLISAIFQAYNLKTGGYL